MLAEAVILGIGAVAVLVFGHGVWVTRAIAKLPLSLQSDIAALKADVAAVKTKVGIS